MNCLRTLGIAICTALPLFLWNAAAATDTDATSEVEDAAGDVETVSYESAVIPAIPPARGNLLGLPDGAFAHGGSVMVCGGGDLDDKIYEEFVRLAGGKKARIVLIPSAYPYVDSDEIRETFSGWLRYNVTSFDFLNTDDPDEADNDDFVEPLLKATGVWIAGGDQGRLAERYNGRKVEKALHRVVERGGVVAGFSAGAAIMSRKIIRDGSATAVVTDTGFGLLDRTVVDSHFSQRGRHTRLLSVIDDYPDLIGLGVDEGTALIIRGNHLRVLGDSRATIIIPRGPNQPLVLHRLRDGDEADVMLVGSALGTGPATVELLTRGQ